MGLREKLHERVKPYLKEGEQVVAVMPGQTGVPPWTMAFMGGALMAILAKPRILLVTDKRLVVLKAGKLTGTKPTEVLKELPRSVRIGPAKGVLWHRADLGGEPIWIHRRFHKDVDAADAAAA